MVGREPASWFDVHTLLRLPPGIFSAQPHERHKGSRLGIPENEAVYRPKALASDGSDTF